MNTLNALKEQEKIAERNWRELQAQRISAEQAERDAKLDYLKPLVIRAHDLLCEYNHTDGCGWFYEIDSKTKEHNWDGGQYSSHARWLAHYEELMKKKTYGKPITVEQLFKLFDHLEILKKDAPNCLWLLRNGLCV